MFYYSSYSQVIIQPNTQFLCTYILIKSVISILCFCVCVFRCGLTGDIIYITTYLHALCIYIYIHHLLVHFTLNISNHFSWKIWCLNIDMYCVLKIITQKRFTIEGSLCIESLWKSIKNYSTVKASLFVLCTQCVGRWQSGTSVAIPFCYIFNAPFVNNIFHNKV